MLGIDGYLDNKNDRQNQTGSFSSALSERTCPSFLTLEKQCGLMARGVLNVSFFVNFGRVYPLKLKIYKCIFLPSLFSIEQADKGGESGKKGSWRKDCVTFVGSCF